MKNYCIIHILLFILLMLVYQCTQAQDYVLLTAGDRIEGAVKPITFGTEKKVQLTSTDKKRTVYSILQVKEFSFKDEIYHPVKGDQGYVFMKLLKPGYLALYAYQLDNQITYDGFYLKKRDGSGTDVPNLSFKKQMARFLGDCPNVVADINNGTLGKKSIDKVVDAYNACIDERTVNHDKGIAQNQDKLKKINSWDVLEEKVKASSDFEGKNDALEMITDIRSKIQRNEKIPNFLLEGLKNSLAKADLATELENALNEIKN
jgi:hypothetical protein